MEQSLMLWIHAHAGPLGNAVFAPSPLLGAFKLWAPLAAAAAVWFAFQARWKWAAVWGGLDASTVLLVEGLKRAVGRARPQLWDWPAPAKGASFPSGHSVCSATFFFLIAFMIGRSYPKMKAPAYAAAALLTLEVGVGRLYHGVHWPTDVLAGWLIGLGQLALALKLAKVQDERL